MIETNYSKILNTFTLNPAEFAYFEEQAKKEAEYKAVYGDDED